MNYPSSDFLQKKLPAGSFDYCIQLWKEYPFKLVINKKRLTKNGDYRFDRRNKSHTITVNENLNPYAFLITYIHEVAHRSSYEIYGRKISPHGKEWKDEFKRLMEPMISINIFPVGVYSEVKRHMLNPKASSHSDHRMTKALAKYDIDEGTVHLDDIEMGKDFIFRKKVYKKLEKRRTRVVCEEIRSGRRYLISGSADVEPSGIS